MEILENREAWEAAYRDGWLAHLQETGETNFRLYQPPKNSAAPGAPGVDLSRSRLMFITSAGGYIRGKQEPFDAANPTGDYTIRLFPADTPLSGLAYAHDHYDHAAVEQDPQVALPLPRLEVLVAQGVIGSLSPSVVSFMGYQPDVIRTIEELIPQIVRVAEAEKPQAALLAPL
jgi:hypothetical protein